MEVKRDELIETEEASSTVEEDIAKPGEVVKEEGDDQAPEPEDKDEKEYLTLKTELLKPINLNRSWRGKIFV